MPKIKPQNANRNQRSKSKNFFPGFDENSRDMATFQTYCSEKNISSFCDNSDVPVMKTALNSDRKKVI